MTDDDDDELQLSHLFASNSSTRHDGNTHFNRTNGVLLIGGPVPLNPHPGCPSHVLNVCIYRIFPPSTLNA